MSISKIQHIVRKNAGRVASLGNWPPYIPAESLLSRIPADTKGSGFDAGLACALDLIPRNKQRLSATLHAAYTPEAVAQVLKESETMDPDSETVWWLAACHVCDEGAVVDEDHFLWQIHDFKNLVSNAEARVEMARDELEVMQSTFETETYGFPHGIVDGCIQGAYLVGHQFGTIYAKEYNLYFIGTYLPTLGLEEFEWSDEVDEQGRPLSGPVHGSRQFVKCKDLPEFLAAVEVVKRHLAG